MSYIEAWAYRVKLSDETVATRVGDQVDGATLVALQQEELRSLLGILSPPARRRIWEIIEGLRSQQQGSEFSVAINDYKMNIETLSIAETLDKFDDRIPLDMAEQLRSDAVQQRQLLEDRVLAFRLQDACHLSEQTSERADMARNEHFRLQELTIRSEVDRKYAAVLAPRGQRPPARSPDEVASLLDLAIDTFVKNRVNVSEVPQRGEIQKLTYRGREHERGVMSKKVKEDKANALVSLPTISRCDVCYAERISGFFLACNDAYCIHCMTNLFKAALKDSSRLPLRCCDIPIDMHSSGMLLNKEELGFLQLRLEERQTTSRFINFGPYR